MSTDSAILHFVIESASMTPAQQRRVQRQLDVQEHACRLVIERGYDGFTMDDLAEAVGVSRRTLFNLVADKESSVLGPLDGEDKQTLLSEFAHQPATGGSPIRDAVAFVRQILRRFEDDDHVGPDHHELVQKAAAGDAKVRQLLMARFTAITETAADAFGRQQQWAAGDLRARVAASVLLALVQQALQEQAERPDPIPLPELFEEVLDAAADAGIHI